MFIVAAEWGFPVLPVLPEGKELFETFSQEREPCVLYFSCSFDVTKAKKLTFSYLWL